MKIVRIVTRDIEGMKGRDIYGTLEYDNGEFRKHLSEYDWKMTLTENHYFAVKNLIGYHHAHTGDDSNFAFEFKEVSRVTGPKKTEIIWEKK